MLSLIIINSEIYERYQRYAYFFNWFEDNGNIVVCQWNKGAADKSDIDETVPMLFDVIKNTSEWNAYIIDEPHISEEYIADDFVNKTQYSINPYERDHGEKESYSADEDPLLQLVYILGGRGVEKLEYITDYKFRAVRPTHIFLMTPRIFENLEIQKMFLSSEIEHYIDEKVEVGPLSFKMKDYEYSAFWERYEYSPNCRFFVFDFPDCESTSYENSWFLFWLVVYTLVLNEFSNPEIEPYKLHKVSIDISKERFEHFLDKNYSALCDAKDASEKDIENELALIKSSKQDISSNCPLERSPVFVNFPHVEFEDFYTYSEQYGILKDRPVLDTDVWRSFYDSTFENTLKLFKATQRGKNEAIDFMNQTLAVDVPLLKNRHLSKYDAEDIAAQLNEDEMKMLEIETDNKATRSDFEKKVASAAATVEKAMKKRLLKKTFLKIVAVGMLIVFLGYIPFVISSLSQNYASLLIALLTGIVSAVVVLVSGVIGLKKCRKKFGDVLSGYNGAVEAAMADIKQGAVAQGDYLTLLQDYIEKYQMLKSGRVDEKQLKHLEYLTMVKGNFEEALDRCTSLAGLCHIKLKRLNSVDLDNPIIFLPNEKIYLHEDTYDMKMPLNLMSDRLDTPFAFIEGLCIEKEMLYEIVPDEDALRKESENE